MFLYLEKGSVVRPPEMILDKKPEGGSNIFSIPTLGPLGSGLVQSPPLLRPRLLALKT